MICPRMQMTVEVRKSGAAGHLTPGAMLLPHGSLACAGLEMLLLKGMTLIRAHALIRGSAISEEALHVPYSLDQRIPYTEQLRQC